MLSGVSSSQQEQYLSVHGRPRLQSATITDPDEFSMHLDTVMHDGIAWEHEEFVPGQTCAAVGVHDRAGMIVGSVAVSAKSGFMVGREREVEMAFRDTANKVSKYFRTGR